MISLLLAMLRTCRGQAVTLMLLTLVVVGATVAVPAYLTAGPPPRDGILAGLDGRPTQVHVTGRVRALPRLGTEGTLIDLEYANRISTDAGSTHRSEVWLNTTAPPTCSHNSPGRASS